jgi:hypothetical protein
MRTLQEIVICDYDYYGDTSGPNCQSEQRNEKTYFRAGDTTTAILAKSNTSSGRNYNLQEYDKSSMKAIAVALPQK